MAIKLFINPVSGSGKGSRIAAIIAGYEPIIINPERICSQIKNHVHEGDIIFIAGGDGTISLIINGLVRCNLSEKVRLLLYPTGTGNDLCRSLGIYTKKFDGDTIQNRVKGDQKTITLPLWEYHESYFICYLSLGISPKILASVAHYRNCFPSSKLINLLLYTYFGLYYKQYYINQESDIRISDESISLKNKSGVVLSNIDSYAGGSKIGCQPINAESLCVTIFSNYWDLYSLVANRFSPNPQPPPCSVTTYSEIKGSEIPIEIDGEVIKFFDANVSTAGKITFLV